jgi:hypothetical protein
MVMGCPEYICIPGRLKIESTPPRKRFLEGALVHPQNSILWWPLQSQGVKGRNVVHTARRYYRLNVLVRPRDRRPGAGNSTRLLETCSNLSI